MQIYLNGEPKDGLPANLTVADLVARLDLGERRIAVEIDGRIVPRSKHAHTELEEGNRVEIVAAIGGG